MAISFILCLIVNWNSRKREVIADMTDRTEKFLHRTYVEARERLVAMGIPEI